MVAGPSLSFFSSFSFSFSAFSSAFSFSFSAFSSSFSAFSSAFSASATGSSLAIAVVAGARARLAASARAIHKRADPLVLSSISFLPFLKLPGARVDDSRVLPISSS